MVKKTAIFQIEQQLIAQKILFYAIFQNIMKLDRLVEKSVIHTF